MNYERQDASLRVVGIATALLTLSLAVSLAMTAWWYFAQAGGADAHPSVSRQSSFTVGPTAEPDILRDRRAVDAVARARLQGYGWVDGEHGVAHIPIERAMELIVTGRKPAPAPNEVGQAP